jgi:hypothetical protein
METEAITIEADVAANAAQAELLHVLSLPVGTPEEKRVALESLKQLSARHRELEKRRKELTAPIDESKKRVMSLFRPALEKLDKAIEQLKLRIGAYEQKVEKERAAAMATATAALAAGDQAGAQAAIVKAFGQDDGHVDGSYNRTTWHFEVVDAAAIPREYLQPNEQLIGHVVRENKGAVAIPGVRVWSETKPVVRTAGGVS